MQNNTLKNWEEKNLIELCNIEIGKTPNRSTLQFWDKNLLTNNTWLSIADLSNSINKEVFKSKEQISDMGASTIKLVKKGTLLLSFKLTIGRVAIAGKDLYTNEAIAQLPIKDKNKIDKYYLYYYLQNFNYDKLLNGDIKVKGKTLNKEKLKTIPIKYPPLLEQQRIVKILDEVFENIEKAKKNVEQNLNNVKELYEDIQKNIFNGNFPQKKLGDICCLYQGLAINAKTKHLLVEKSSLPLLRIKDLKENTVSQYVKEEGYPINALVQENDIIYTRTGSLGLVFSGKRGILHNNSFKVVPNDEIYREYLIEYLKNPNFKKKIISFAERAAQPDITHSIFKQQNIPIPSKEIQKVIIEKLVSLQEQTKKLEQIYIQKIKDLDELKQSILQKAFNGDLV